MEKVKYPPIRALMLITTERLSERAIELFKESNVPLQYTMNALGTASSEIIDMLGLGDEEKRLIISVLPKKKADLMLTKLHNELSMNSVNTGIAFTVGLTGANSLLLKLIASKADLTEATNENASKAQEGEKASMNENKHSLIAAIINRGFSSEVMVAAREVGARGGTVVHSRELIGEEAAGLWGANMQEEKEVLLILSDNDTKLSIMKAISEKFGTHSKANGLVISLPIDSVMGV